MAPKFMPPERAEAFIIHPIPGQIGFRDLNQEMEGSRVRPMAARSWPLPAATFSPRSILARTGRNEVSKPDISHVLLMELKSSPLKTAGPFILLLTLARR